MSAPIKLKCPSCGAVPIVQGDRLICEYCGTVQAWSPPSAEVKAPVAEVKPPANSGKGDADVQRGIDAYKAGRFTEAIQALEAAVQAGVKQFPLTDVYTIMGNSFNDLDNSEKAIPCFLRANALDDRYYKGWVGMGIAYRKMGDFAEAERCYKEAMRREPKYAELHASLGALYIFQDKPELAVPALQKAIALDPSVAVAHSNLALALAMLRRFSEADAALRRAVSLGYKSYKTVQDRINALRSLG